VVTIYTAGAAAELMTAATSSLASVGTTLATGVAALSGGVSGVVGIAAAAIGGAIGSIASQAVGIATGNQSGFNWGEVALGAIGAGVGAGVGQVVRGAGIIGQVASSTNPYVVAGVESAVGNAITQGVSVATGLQSSFHWQDVAIAAVSAPLAKYVGGKVSGGPGDILSKLASGAAGAAVRIAVGGKVNSTQVLADAFGNALGNSLVDAEGTTGRVGTTADTANQADQLDEVKVTAQRINTFGDTLEKNPEPQLQDIQFDPNSIPIPNVLIQIVAPAGASISTIMGSSNPLSIEAFMHANGMTGTDSTIYAGQTYNYPGDEDFAASTGVQGQAVLDADNLKQLQPLTPTAVRLPVNDQLGGTADLSVVFGSTPTVTQQLLSNADSLSNAADQYSNSSLTGLALRQAASDNYAAAGAADLLGRAWKWLQTPFQPGVQTQQFMMSAAQQQVNDVNQELADPNLSFLDKVMLYQAQANAYNMMGYASQVPTRYLDVGLAGATVVTTAAPLIRGVSAAGKVAEGVEAADNAAVTAVNSTESAATGAANTTTATTQTPLVRINNEVGTLFDKYVYEKRFAQMEDTNATVVTQRQMGVSGLDQDYVQPDYSVYTQDGEIAFLADAKAGAIEFDTQAKGLIQLSQQTLSKTVIYYTPDGTTLIPKTLRTYAQASGVEIRQVGVH
jgi:hypothetical protein